MDLLFLLSMFYLLPLLLCCCREGMQWCACVVAKSLNVRVVTLLPLFGIQESNSGHLGFFTSTFAPSAFKIDCHSILTPCPLRTLSKKDEYVTIISHPGEHASKIIEKITNVSKEETAWVLKLFMKINYFIICFISEEKKIIKL